MINIFCKLVGHGWIETTLITEDNEITLAPPYDYKNLWGYEFPPQALIA